MDATQFYRERRKDKVFKESIDAVRGQAVIDFAEAYHKQALSEAPTQISDEEIEAEAMTIWVSIIPLHGRQFKKVFTKWYKDFLSKARRTKNYEVKKLKDNERSDGNSREREYRQRQYQN